MSDDTRTLKAYMHPLTAIVIPAGQAVVSSLAGFTVAGSVAWYYGYPNPLAIGGVAGGVLFGVSWLISLLWWRSRVEGISAPSQAQPVTPAEIFPAETVRVELVNPANSPYLQVDILDVPFSRDLLVRAAGHLHDRSWETSNLGGANKPLTRSQAEALRSWMISEELAAWYRDDRHTLGWVILPAGRALLRRFWHAGVVAGDIILPPPRPEKTPGERFFEQQQTHTSTQTDGWRSL